MDKTELKQKTFHALENLSEIEKRMQKASVFELKELAVSAAKQSRQILAMLAAGVFYESAQ